MTTMTRRTMLALLTAGATSAAVPQLAQAAQSTARTSYSPALPEPTGPYRIGTTELHLVDKTRQDPWVPGRVRELMTSIWYPALPVLGGPRAPYAPVHAAGPLADQIGAVLELKPGSIDLAGTTTHARIAAPALGRHPVLLYSPGMGTSRLMGTNHVEELASRGYVVVAMDHTGEAPVEFPRGRVVPLTMPTSEDVIKPATAVRVADTRFVLDTLARLAAGVNPDAERRPLPIGAVWTGRSCCSRASTTRTCHSPARRTRTDPGSASGIISGAGSSICGSLRERTVPSPTTSS